MEFSVRYRRQGRWSEAAASDFHLIREPAGEKAERIRVRLRVGDVEQVAIAFPAGADEHFFGFGEKFNAVDQRGRLVDLYVRNGASGDETYKPIPFWMSTAGYGCALVTERRAWVAAAHPLEPDAVVATVEGAELEAVLFTGGSLKELLTAYTGWVGRPPCPEPWVFGPWKSRDWRVEDGASVRVDLERQRELGLAATVKLIDAGWTTEPNNFIWDRVKYPDPDGLIQDARRMGYEVVLWVCSWFIQGTTIWSQLAESGFFCRKADGTPYVHRLANSPDLLGSMLDFTNPDAIAWWQAGIRGLMEMGVRGIKTDFGEQIPADAVCWDGRSGEIMHNLYPRLYNEATWAVVSKYNGILLARSAWAGSQRFPGIWAGDQTADFAPWSGLPSVIRAGQSAGLSGFPYWASDIGGYFSSPTPDCFTRWAEFGAFSPIMQIHGLGEHDPWNMGAEALAIYRRFADLRCRLFPYIYTCAQTAAQTGLPIMRALPLEFEEDPGVYANDFATFQYMFGPDLLVAPVAWDSMRQRRVYLPAGADWVDLWTGEEHPGGTILYAQTPQERIPVYVRKGAILPLQQNAMPLGSSDREIRIYPNGDSAVTLYDGTTYTFQATGAQVRVAVSGAPAQATHRIQIWTADGWRTMTLGAGQTEGRIDF
ncbi:MAG: TIM-barrel domain-containing protein [Mycobacterium leprae]